MKSRWATSRPVLAGKGISGCLGAAPSSRPQHHRSRRGEVLDYANPGARHLGGREAAGHPGYPVDHHIKGSALFTDLSDTGKIADGTGDFAKTRRLDQRNLQRRHVEGQQSIIAASRRRRAPRSAKNYKSPPGMDAPVAKLRWVKAGPTKTGRVLVIPVTVMIVLLPRPLAPRWCTRGRVDGHRQHDVHRLANFARCSATVGMARAEEQRDLDRLGTAVPMCGAADRLSWGVRGGAPSQALFFLLRARFVAIGMYGADLHPVQGLITPRSGRGLEACRRGSATRTGPVRGVSTASGAAPGRRGDLHLGAGNVTSAGGTPADRGANRPRGCGT